MEKFIKVGDICAYFYDNHNKSFSVVEVVKELSEDCVVVKFQQVLCDDSGNDLFTYLCENGKTMNVSRKYLHKLNLTPVLIKVINEFVSDLKKTMTTAYETVSGYRGYETEDSNIDELVEKWEVKLKCALF